MGKGATIIKKEFYEGSTQGIYQKYRVIIVELKAIPEYFIDTSYIVSKILLDSDGISTSIVEHSAAYAQPTSRMINFYRNPHPKVKVFKYCPLENAELQFNEHVDYLIQKGFYQIEKETE